MNRAADALSQLAELVNSLDISGQVKMAIIDLAETIYNEIV